MSEDLGDAVLTLRTNNLAFNTGLKSAEARMAAFSAKARAAGLALTAGLTLPIVGLGVVATKAFVGFNKAMTGSLAIMGDVTDAMRDRMTVAARKMGRETLFSAEQAAESYFFLASAGLDAATSVEALPIVARFAQAGLFDMALATDLLTDAFSALGMKTGDVTKDMEEMTRVSDVLAKANQTANATIQQFSEALTNEAGAALKSANKDVEEGVAVLAAFADQGVKGNVAGSALSRIMRLMGSAAVNNTKAMKELGVTVLDAQGNWLNFADIIGSMEEAFDGMSDAQRIAALESMGFTARVQGVILPLLGTSEAIREYEAAYREAMGTTLEISEKQLESASAQWTLFKGVLDDVLIVLGGALVPALLSLMEALVPVAGGIGAAVDAFAKLPTPVQNVAFAILGILAALGPVIFLIGALAGGVSALAPIWVALMASFAGPGLLAVGAGLSGILLPLALVAAAVALVYFNWERLEPIIAPVVAVFAAGLTDIATRIKNTGVVLQDFYLLAIKPFFDFVMNNTPALVLALTAIGVAFAWAFPPFGIALAIVALIGVFDILRAENDELSISALKAKIVMLQLGESFLVGAQAAKDAVLSGFGPLGGAADWLADKFDGLDEKTNEMHGRVRDAQGALIDMTIAQRTAAADTAFLTDNMAALLPVMEGGDLAISRYAMSLAIAEVANFNATHAIQLTTGEAAAMTQQIFSSRKEMLLAARDSKTWSNAVVRAAAEAGVSVTVYKAQLLAAAQAAVVMAAAQAFLNSTLSNVGSNLASFITEAAKLPALMAAVRDAIRVGGGESGDGNFDGLGTSIGESIAEDLVPAFIRAMQKEEARLGAVAGIIESAISARNVKWDDVARLYELGAVGIAEDFMDALNGKASEIGLQIEDALADDAREAGERAAAEFMKAWEAGIGQMESVLQAALNAVGDVTSTFTREDAELELNFLQQQRQAKGIINYLERARASLLERINRIQEKAAAQVAVIQERIANNRRAVDQLRDAVSRLRDQINEIEEAADRRIANLEGEIEVIEAWGAAQIDAVRATIDANDDIIDGLNDQLEAKREILKVDKETLRAHRSSVAENARLLKDLESQLKAVQDERAKAFAVLGLTPDGGAPAPTLLSSAENLKRLQDLQSQRAAPTAGLSVVDQSAGFRERSAALQAEIDEAQALFDQLAEAAAAEAERLQAEVESKARLVANEERLIEQLIVKIALDEEAIEAIQDAKEAIQDQNDALREQIEIIEDSVDRQVSAIEEQIEAIEDLRDAQVSALEDQIDVAEDMIKVIEERIRQDEELIDSINAVADAQVAALEAQVAVIDDQIKQVEDHIEGLKEEIRLRAEDRRIMQLTLQLEHDLLETDAELAVRVQQQIRQADALRRIMERVRDGTADAKDALRLLGMGLEDLAALILAIVSDPSLQIPAFAAGAVNVPRDTLAMVHAGEMIIPAKPAAAVRQALVGGQSGGSSPRSTRPVEVHQEFHVEDASPAALAHRMRMSALGLGAELAKETR